MPTPKLIMTPSTGDRAVRFTGDRVTFSLRLDGIDRLPEGWRAYLRTNLGRDARVRQEIIASVTAEDRAAKDSAWRDVPMRPEGDHWTLDLTLTESGYYQAKAHVIDNQGWQLWPDGPDAGISVHPDACRTGNIIYCAFPRLFGETRVLTTARDEAMELQLKSLDKQGYAAIPPSGKLRDLARQVPHIINTLGCRIIQLLPVNPTPTTYARMGRYGSPYACGDLTGIDPALVEFDRRTTAVDQFRELADTVHQHSGRLFLDLVINHTGWGSPLQDEHPEWFLRNEDGIFVSPGAWGTIWEDLVELNHHHRALWVALAEVFLTWCRRGVDGFRCDAGYKVPLPVWRYITARVRAEFPAAVFLLEGLGGAWHDTEALLTEGAMQWAYSELFQEYSGPQVAGYLEHALKQSQRSGVLVHYAETHDNNRLAAKGRVWSLLRNRLSGLASVCGGYGFTNGVEWLASEKILVHQNAGLAWDNPDNIVTELKQLNTLLTEHPCFFDGAKLTRLSPSFSPVYGLLRESAEGLDRALVLVNTDPDQAQAVELPAGIPAFLAGPLVDLLGQIPPEAEPGANGTLRFTLPPGGAYCLAETLWPVGLAGAAYRQARARVAWAVQALAHSLEPEQIGPFVWTELAAWVDESPERFLTSLARISPARAAADLLAALREAAAANDYPRIVLWEALDHRRVTPVPPGHWLLIRERAPFQAQLQLESGAPVPPADSVAAGGAQVVCFPPRAGSGRARLHVERFAAAPHRIHGTIEFLSPGPRLAPFVWSGAGSELALLTNGRGGMARMCADLGRITSKYDCVLGANLHPTVPVDRHILVKRLRVWALASAFLSPMNGDTLVHFEPGPPARWRFRVNAGDGRCCEVEMTADMVAGKNTTRLRFQRVSAGREIDSLEVRLTVRADIEDRNFHAETKRNGGAEHHFATNTHPLQGRPGFLFSPAPDRQARVFASGGRYHAAPEWCIAIPHPVEQTRGQVGDGDAYSPGWFELPLTVGEPVTVIATAEIDEITALNGPGAAPPPEPGDAFSRALTAAARAFVVRRDAGKTVIAGYPWFLDWGRDTLICARGLLAAGMISEVRDILLVFAKFEQDGTLPNIIHGLDASNRDTTDAPLWFGVVCEELGARLVEEPGGEAAFYQTVVDTATGRTIQDVLRAIARGYVRGTPNGIRVDPRTGLVWSPSHFTWMDTNHPAGTPREGYPIEIQALWIRLANLLQRIEPPAEAEAWGELASQATGSLERLYWREEEGYFADVLLATRNQSAAESFADNALRSNCLLPISLGLVKGERARKTVQAVQRYLVIPGALRSLAPKPVYPALAIYGNQGQLLNDPMMPYWGHYAGDEDTRRKPAYHNGTAWTWTFPAFAEALVQAWDGHPDARAAAKAYLGSSASLLNQGCLGQLPEILDGDAPHAQRGCDAQAWGATEALRVWRALQANGAPDGARAKGRAPVQ